ncbi:MAG TPA: exonuclease SbcCD subunit D [Nocardioides sp.]|uniref:exonuclease SbcCD subunit D n=1 Tax=Nocardioides sp. TaxID=35761 RepID=UPI002BF2B71C|nr:exonuclease SbcCD subunit D [Nocardioides sp.]HQR26880.1 exonuclease SbcCD subunit D [Nocardioides sp.]
MRILHTSDWHLGRSFHRESMLTHQAAFADHLLEVVAAEQVDLVVVAGDVYDRALPPVDAVRLADDTLARLASSRATVVVTSGNHDSAHRLGFGSRLIDAAGVHIRADAAQVGVPVTLADEHGPVAVYALPYLDPESVREAWGLAGRSHQAALAEALRRVRLDLATLPAGTRSVVVAHAFVAGGRPSDSERDIAVGGVQVVPAALFDGIDYTALGHLHGRQSLTPRVRYSGSPLAYSFSEAAHVKGSWLVDLGVDEPQAEFVEAPVPRSLARLSGTLEELLHDPRHSTAETSWVEVTLTDDVRPGQAMERLRRRFPHTLLLSFAPTHPPPGEAPVARPTGRSDHEIALEFVAELRGRPATPAERALLGAACDAVPDDPDADVLGRGA